MSCVDEQHFPNYQYTLSLVKGLYNIMYLQDFRNYQYTLPTVKGLVVDMEVKKTCIKIPSNRYNEVRLSTNHIAS